MRVNLKRVSAAVLAMSLLTTSFAGCTKDKKEDSGKKSADNSSGQVAEDKVSGTVTFWHTYSANSEAKLLEKEIIPEFNKKYPNIKIKSVTMPTDNLKQQVLQAAANGSAPDIMRMDITWVPQFANLNSLVAVDDMKGFDTIKTDSYPATLSTCQWKGKYYGIPLDTNTQAAIYNKKDLEAAGLSEAPKTFDELTAAAEKIKSGHKNGLIGISGMGMWSMAPWFMSLGGQYCDEKYTKADGYINSDASVKALEKLVELNDNGMIGKCLLNGQPGTWDGLKADNGYMTISDGPWFFTLQDKKVTDNCVLATIPSSTSKSISVVGGEDMVMFKNCKNKQAAWIFMRFMTEEYAQKTMALKVNQYPTNAKVGAMSELTDNPVFKVYNEQLKTSWARIPNPSNEEMDSAISLAFEKAFRHKGTVKENLDSLAKKLDELFAKNK